MCPEILQLLTKGEIVFDMCLDDELATSRLPIPLIYRPLRQLVYGVLFGVKQNEGCGRTDIVVVVDKDEKSQNGVADDDETCTDEKCKENGLPEVEGTCEESKPETIKQEVKQEDVEDTEGAFTVKEWCIYEDRSLDKPDFVKAKGMY